MNEEIQTPSSDPLTSGASAVVTEAFAAMREDDTAQLVAEALEHAWDGGELHVDGAVRAIEAADWQVILLTHDPQLSRAARTEAPDWLDEKVTAWTPRSGPSFGPGEMRTRLKERLDAGEPAEELGGMARLAIEEALERPIQKMGLKIRYDRDNGYPADEYRRALIDGLKAGKFPRGRR